MYCPKYDAKMRKKLKPSDKHNQMRIKNKRKNGLYHELDYVYCGIDFKSFFTWENIERYAPLGALLPLVKLIILQLINFVLGDANILGFLHEYITLFKLINVIFTTAAGFLVVGLVCVVVGRKNVNRINSWIGLIGVIFGFASCIGKKPFSVITGLIAMILGLEFLARIVIAGQPLTSKFNLAGALDIYKQFIEDRRINNQLAPGKDKLNGSYFDGTGWQLWGYTLVTIIVCMITGGIAAPWMLGKIYEWQIEHTVIDGKRLTFKHNKTYLLGRWKVRMILSVAMSGIYVFVAYIFMTKCGLESILVEGILPMLGGNEASYVGIGIGYVWYGILSGYLLVMMFCFLYLRAMEKLQGWDTNQQMPNIYGVDFEVDRLGLYKEVFVIVFLTVITFGIYSPWGNVRMLRCVVKHTRLVDYD